MSEFILRMWVEDFSLSPNWKYHAILGWSQVPNLKFQQKVLKETVLVSFNSAGFRDKEHQKQKPNDVKRLVVIGDSVTEALQVNLEDTYFSLLEQKLNSNSNQKWEIINLAVGDFGTAQEWIALNEFGLSYNPDIVILQIFPLNDVCNNSIELFEACGSPNDLYRPYFVQSNGELHLTQAQPVRGWLRRNVKTYGLFERVFFEGKNRIEPKTTAQLRDEKIKELGLQGRPQFYTYAPENQQIAPIVEGWMITESIVEKIMDLTNHNKIKLFALVVPFEKCVGNSNWASFHADKPEKVDLIKEYPEKRLGALFDRIGLSSVMLLEIFENHQNEVLPYLDGHLNHSGHLFTANALYEKIREFESDRKN